MEVDGYFFYGHTARKLRDAVERDLCDGHVEGRLLRCCASEDDMAGLPADSRIASVVRRHHEPARPPTAGIIRVRPGSRTPAVTVADTALADSGSA